LLGIAAWAIIMGAERIRTEPNTCNEFKDNAIVWHYCKEGGTIPFLECLNGHDESLSIQCASSWADRQVTIGSVSFEISEKSIAEATGLSLKGIKLLRKIRVSDAQNLKLFLGDGEELVPYQGGFERAKLPQPWADMCFLIMKYFTLEGRYARFYYYHLPLLNHFHRNLAICFPYYLLSSLDHSVKMVHKNLTSRPLEKPVPLHQGLIHRLYQFHLALMPPATLHHPAMEPSPNTPSASIKCDSLLTPVKNSHDGPTSASVETNTPTPGSTSTPKMKDSVKSRKRLHHLFDLAKEAAILSSLKDSHETPKGKNMSTKNPAKKARKGKGKSISPSVRRSTRIARKPAPKVKLIDYSESNSEASSHSEEADSDDLKEICMENPISREQFDGHDSLQNDYKDSPKNVIGTSSDKDEFDHQSPVEAQYDTGEGEGNMNEQNLVGAEEVEANS